MSVLFSVFALSVEDHTICTKKLFLIHYYSSELALFASIAPAEFKKTFTFKRGIESQLLR